MKRRFIANLFGDVDTDVVPVIFLPPLLYAPASIFASIPHCLNCNLDLQLQKWKMFSYLHKIEVVDMEETPKPPMN
jgi:hypothetical protein